jgi:localization factor PodJL
MAFSADRDPDFDHDVLAQARRAARRAGMSLGEWLDTVVEIGRGNGERGPRGRSYDPSSTADTIAAIQARLDAFERRQGRHDMADPDQHASRDALRRLEERLDAIARRGATRGSYEDTVLARASRAEPFVPARRTDSKAAHNARVGGEPVADLKEAIAAIAARQQTLERDFDEALAGHADRIDHRLDTVAERLERSIENVSPRSEIRDLEAEMRAIAARLDHDRGTPATDLREEFADLVRRLDDMPPRLAEEMAIRLEDTARRLDTATRSELDSIRAEMREIAHEIDQATRSGFESVHAELAKLMSRIEQAGDFGHDGTGVGLDNTDRTELAAIREEIRALASQLDNAQRNDRDALHQELQGLSQRIDAGSPDRLQGLERHVESLVERMNAAGPAENTSGLAEIERQIARLAERMEQTPDRSDELAGLNQRIGELFSYLEENHATSDVVCTLREELTALKLNVDQADKRNQSTLEAVHDTLNKIVNRLNELEDEVEEVAEGTRPHGSGPAMPERSAPGTRHPHAPEPELDTDDIVGRIETVSRSFKAEADDHTPLEPGSGPPLRAESMTDDTPDAGHKSDRESFIAAARRAAQAAAAEPRAAREDGAAPKPGGLGAFFSTYRRPILIGVAMVILVFGAMKAAEVLTARGGGNDGAALPGSERVGSSDATGNPQATEAPIAGGDEAKDMPRVVDRRPQTAAPITTGSIPARADRNGSGEGASQTADTDSAPGEDETANTSTRSAAALEMPPVSVGSEQLRQAAYDGDPAAQFEVAVRYTEGHGVAQDFTKAAYWYRQAAAQGLAPAQYRLGSLYEKGHGVTRDMAMARTWYQRAAEQGNRTAMHNLAVLHAEGAEGEPNYEQAALWFRQSSEYGLKDSQYNLAVLHARGLGVEQNLAESYRWFAAAAEQGDEEAAVQREEIAAGSTPTRCRPRDLSRKAGRPNL